MRLGEWAARGRRLRDEQERATREASVVEAEERGLAVGERHARRLARMYGVDPDARGFSIYLGVMAVVLFGIGAGARYATGGGAGLGIGLACGVGVGLLAVTGWAVHARSLRAQAIARASLRALPFPFDADDYERVAAAFDHSTGWARVSVHFDGAWLVVRPELRAEIADACVAFHAMGTRWVDERRLWIKSPTFDTDVSTENASYRTCRPIHAWVHQLLTRDLPGVHGAAPIQRVSVRFGFFSNGSYDVDQDDEGDDFDDEEDREGDDAEA